MFIHCKSFPIRALHILMTSKVKETMFAIQSEEVRIRDFVYVRIYPTLK